MVALIRAMKKRWDCTTVLVVPKGACVQVPVDSYIFHTNLPLPFLCHHSLTIWIGKGIFIRVTYIGNITNDGI